MFRRIGTSLSARRASCELGSVWEFLRAPRRASAPDAPRTPHRLARDLLQVVQETVFAKKFDERRCPLVKEESDLSSEEGTDRRIANLIDFFFTIVKSQRDDRKSSSGSCFKTESPTEVRPRKVNIELEKKMETLMEFLATTGCMEDDATKDEKKITLMEFLFGPENKPLIEINHQIEKREMTLSESNINVKLSYIDETPVEEGADLVDMLIKYMENYDKEPMKYMLTPSLSEKSKSDVTISKIETYSDMSKTKSDSTLTHTQDTVIEREMDNKFDSLQSSRRISETVVDLSNIKQDLEDIFTEAIVKVCELKKVDVEDDVEMCENDDTMSEAEDMRNFDSYTKPPLFYNIQCMPYSVELSDIIEEDESLDPSSRGQEDRMMLIRECAEELVDLIEDRIQTHFDESSDDEFDISASLKQSSISLIDLRSIPDLPPSMIIKPKVVRVDKSTSTTEISESISDLSRRYESGCMTEDTSLTNSSERHAERALDKLENLHKFFSRSRLEIISEHDEYRKDRQRHRSKGKVMDSENRSAESRHGQASLDDVEELQDEVLDVDMRKIIEEIEGTKTETEFTEDADLDIQENDDIIEKAEELSASDKSESTSEHCTIDEPFSSKNVNIKANKDDSLSFDSNVLVERGIGSNSDKVNDCGDSFSTSDILNEAKERLNEEIIENREKLEDSLLEIEKNSEADFTEIDKIISEAVKIILVNELEFHREQNTEKEKDNLRGNIRSFDFDRNMPFKNDI